MTELLIGGAFVVGLLVGLPWGVLLGRRGDLERQEAAARWALAGHPDEVVRPEPIEALSEEESKERWDLPAVAQN